MTAFLRSRGCRPARVTRCWYSEVGDIATRSTSLDLTYRPGNRPVVHIPFDGDSGDRLAWLRAHLELALAPHEH
ncbi:hypothetical protein [Frankia sp. AgKG'84/4]|uniref:hypothetical protein n=1 Tax=Frankia sp. AgKG'84/4 TaxID=573490 RepID=UPI00200C3A85|nr:hypothetical protein [Frankia sp. AgKG'84/4]MCL9793254.1 hypothetical protein [Frankia sp. AgKG'84/4]